MFRFLFLGNNIMQYDFFYSYLDSNHLSQIPDGSLAGMTSLTRLHLNNNQLVKIQAGLLDNLTNLQYL